MPRGALPEVLAYDYFVRFGTLPRPGGTFDQPADLLDGMVVVDDVVKRTAESKARQDERSMSRLFGRR